MKCPACGAALKDGQQFCVKCGTPLDGEVVSAASAVGSSGEAMPSVAEVPTQDAWVGATPSKEYDSLSSNEYSTPETVSSSSVQKGSLAEEEYERAREVYREARKKAGKSIVPKVVAGALALVLAAGVGAFISYTLMNSQLEALNNQYLALQGQYDAALTDLEMSLGAVAESPFSKGYENWDDTWEGTLNDEDAESSVLCRAGETTPPILKVTGVTTEGVATGELTVTFHNHSTPSTAVSSCEGDVTLTEEIEFQLDDLSFTHDFDISSTGAGLGSSLSVRASWNSSSVSSPIITLEVTSTSGPLQSQVDLYTLKQT